MRSSSTQQQNPQTEDKYVYGFSHTLNVQLFRPFLWALRGIVREGC